MIKLLRILVPLDFSKESDLALEWAVMMAGKTRGATIYLLHVLPPGAQGFGTVGYKAEQEKLEKQMQKAQINLPADILCFTQFAQGKISEAVHKLSEEKDIDLVIMTTRGRRGMKHFLPESTTEETIRLAPCPVLVLHLNAKNQPLGAKSAM